MAYSIGYEVLALKDKQSIIDSIRVGRFRCLHADLCLSHAHLRLVRRDNGYSIVHALSKRPFCKTDSLKKSLLLLIHSNSASSAKKAPGANSPLSNRHSVRFSTCKECSHHFWTLYEPLASRLKRIKIFGTAVWSPLFIKEDKRFDHIMVPESSGKSPYFVH